MKKTTIVLLVVLASFVFSPNNYAYADELYNRSISSFVLPSSLEIIEEDAFMGTAVKTIFFQEGLLSIGDYAFADSRDLTEVYIPTTVEYLGKNAFSSNKRMTIHGIIGSIAERWAKEHQVPFAPSNIWNEVDDSRNIKNLVSISNERILKAIDNESNNHLRGRTEDEGKSMRPQERPELNPIDYRFP